MPPLPDTTAARFVDPLDLRDITREEYAGHVSHAKETVAELLGPATAAQARAFDASWQPMFAFPAPECIDYLERLIPVAEQALALRVVMLEAARTTSELWERAAAAEYHSPEAARELMLQVRTRTAGVASIKGALDQLIAQLDTLGPPPDPTQIQAQAQSRHRRALRTLESLRVGIQLAILVAVIVTLRLLFPSVLRFVELGARVLRYLWWLILIVALAVWLIWGASRRPN
jgi:hypothetical protein